MKQILISTFSLFCSFAIHAQTTILIPDTLSGSVIDLYMKDSTRQFFTGYQTATIGYNGAFLGPTILLNKGQQVTLNVHNVTNDTTTTHWHGLHVAPQNDGSPHNPILGGAIWSPSIVVRDEAATYWYHPHLHMKTMKQVIKGASGFIIVRDSNESSKNLPRKYGVDDFPLVCQFKTFDNTTKQFVIADELDNAVLVNGTINGQLQVPAQLVRLRLLNGSSHRYFQFAISDNRNFQQITSDEGLLNAPLTMNQLMLAPGERAEIVVDFSGQNGSTYYLKQLGTQLPAGYPGGPPSTMGGMGAQTGPLDNTNFNILQFNVGPALPFQNDSISTTLNNNITPNLTGVDVTTKPFLIQGSPMNSMTNFVINGVSYNENTINFYTVQDSIMIWDITNQSMMPHPWHIHGNYFYVLSINGNTPPPNMRGKKDVITIPPQGGNVKLIMKYADFSDPIYPYMYHCHIASHEDNGMMGQFIVYPKSLGVFETAKTPEIKLFPNPVSDFVTVDIPDKNIPTCTVFFYDYMGKFLSTQEFSTSEHIDIRNFPEGIVFAIIQVGSEIYKSSLIKIAKK